MAFTGSGLKPYRRLDSASLNFSVNQYNMAYNQASSLGTGDVVKMLNTGYVGAAASNDNPVLGVFATVTYANAANTIQPQTQRYWSAPTLGSTVVVTAQVWDDSNIVFAIGSSGASTLTQSCIGANARFISNFAPNTTTGISTLYLDNTSCSNNSTYPLRIVELAPIQGNNLSATNPVLGVVLNTGFYTRTGSGAT